MTWNPDASGWVDASRCTWHICAVPFVSLISSHYTELHPMNCDEFCTCSRCSKACAAALGVVKFKATYQHRLRRKRWGYSGYAPQPLILSLLRGTNVTMCHLLVSICKLKPRAPCGLPQHVAYHPKVWHRCSLLRRSKCNEMKQDETHLTTIWKSVDSFSSVSLAGWSLAKQQPPSSNMIRTYSIMCKLQAQRVERPSNCSNKACIARRVPSRAFTRLKRNGDGWIDTLIGNKI